MEKPIPSRCAHCTGNNHWKCPTVAQLDAAKDEWKENKASFEICQATEKAPIAQIVEAIDPIHFCILLNHTTGQYASNICKVLAHLFKAHGKITPQQVKTAELNVYNMPCNISQPVDAIFNAINDFSELAKHTSSPMTPQQLSYLVYIIFVKQPILQQDLPLWSRKPLTDHTWTNMLTHFREAQTNLSTIPNDSDLYPQKPVHHANAATTMAHLVAQGLFNALPPNDKPCPPVLQPSTINTALQQCKASLAARNTALSNQVQELMALICTGTVTATPNNENTRNLHGGRSRGCNNNHTTPSINNCTAQSPHQCCWSHGTCAHTDVNCNTCQPGHQEAATFDNMMAGSTKINSLLNT